MSEVDAETADTVPIFVVKGVVDGSTEVAVYGTVSVGVPDVVVPVTVETFETRVPAGNGFNVKLDKYKFAFGFTVETVAAPFELIRLVAES